MQILSQPNPKRKYNRITGLAAAVVSSVFARRHRDRDQSRNVEECFANISAFEDEIDFPSISYRQVLENQIKHSGFWLSEFWKTGNPKYLDAFVAHFTSLRAHVRGESPYKIQ